MTLKIETIKWIKANQLQGSMQLGLSWLLIHLGWKSEGCFKLSEEQGSVTAFWKAARVTEEQISKSAGLVDSFSLGFSLKAWEYSNTKAKLYAAFQIVVYWRHLSKSKEVMIKKLPEWGPIVHNSVFSLDANILFIQARHESSLGYLQSCNELTLEFKITPSLN